MASDDSGFSVPILGGLGGWIVRRRARRHKTRDVVECSLRDRSGSTSLLLRRWRAGEAHLAPGVITFEPFVALGFRVRRPRTPSIRIEVHDVSGPLRAASGAERWWFNGLVYEIETADGPLEWGLTPLTDIEWATGLVAGR